MIYLRFFNLTSITSHHNYPQYNPITHPHIPRQIRGIYHTVCRHFPLRIHTIHILSYQPSCYSCLQLAVIFSFVVAKIFLQRCKHNLYDNRSYTSIYFIITINSASLFRIFCTTSKICLAES